MRLAGGEEQIKAKLPGMRIEALRPALISREKTVEGKRPLLRYSYRERPATVP